jgi:Flp pilus assembly pilin Flp
MSRNEHKLKTSRHLLRAESGQTTSEYAVVMVVLIPGLVLLFTGLGGAVVNLITSVARLLP